jgi:spore maturation protein SpmB
MNIKKELQAIVHDTGSTYLFLLKIMIPISIVVKLLEETGAIYLIGNQLTPAMSIVGLPGDFALVLATAMLVNIYGALIVFFQLSLLNTYTVAQVTIVACMMLIAHTLPIEARIAQKAGVRLWWTLCLRILGAFLFGMILNLLFTSFSLFQETSTVIWRPEYTESSIVQWIIGQIGYYIMIFLIILSLMILMHILKKTEVLNKLNTFFKPGLEFLGMSKQAAMLPLIGMTLGLAYGGGLIVKEAASNNISSKDIFLSLSFMGLSHSLIEDTILTLSIGASIGGIFFGRILFTIGVMFCMARCIRVLSTTTFQKYFMNTRS